MSFVIAVIPSFSNISALETCSKSFYLSVYSLNAASSLYCHYGIAYTDALVIYKIIVFIRSMDPL